MFSPAAWRCFWRGKQHLLSLRPILMYMFTHCPYKMGLPVMPCWLLLGSYATFYRSQSGLHMGNKIQSNNQLFYTTLCIFICILFAFMASVEADALVYHRSLSPRKLNFCCCNFRIIVMAYAPLHRSWNSVLIKPWSWKTFLWGLNFLVMLPLPMLFSSLYTHS